MISIGVDLSPLLEKTKIRGKVPCMEGWGVASSGFWLGRVAWVGVARESWRSQNIIITYNIHIVHEY